MTSVSDKPTSDHQAADRSPQLGTLPSFATRAVTSVAYVVAYAVAIWFGKYSTAALMAIIATFCAFEFYSIMRKEGKIANAAVGCVTAALFSVGALFWKIPGIALVAVALVAITLVWYALSVRARFVDVAITIAGSLYAGAFLANFVLLRSADPGITGASLVFAVIASIWANDSFAYLFGSLFGKHKMLPKISPKKSWEGFIAGLLGSILIWLLIPLIPGIGLGWNWAIVGGITTGILAVFGDIVESRLKREAGVKDSGTMLPGHGGFLDRSDSMILASVAAVIVLRLAGVL